MPYVSGATAHGVVHIADVYNSGNVFVNNVAVALHNSAGGSGTFGGVSVSVAVSLDPAVEATLAADTANYVSAQNGQPNQYYSAAASADGVKGNYTGTPDDGTTSTGIIATDASFSDIVPFLTKCLDEAAQGKWRETGQGGKPSNSTILGIWQNLGYASNSPWTTDQTAWCMGFVNYGLKVSGYKYVQTASAAAITTSPERWGAVQVPKDQAQPGDIAWSYRHVNFVYTAQNGKYSFVGGNQTPRVGTNNPDDGDITISYPNGTGANNANWVSCWRPTKS